MKKTSSVLLTIWNRRQQAELRPVDPNTGWDLADYAPIGLGQNFQHAFSPDGQTLACGARRPVSHP